MAAINPLEQSVKEARDQLLAAARKEQAEGVIPVWRGQRFAQENPDIRRAQELTRAHTGEAEKPYQEYLTQMGQHGSKLTLRDISHYFNPYTQQVINRIAKEGQRAFTEKVQPALEGKFSRLGQYGSLRHRKESQKFARDIMQDIHERQQEAMHKGYQQAFEMARGEKERGMESSRLASIINSLKHAAHKTDIESLMSQGYTKQQAEQMQLDFDFQEMMRQAAARQEKIAALSAALHGLPYSAAQVVYPQQQFAHNIAGAQQRHLNPLGQLGLISGMLSGAGRATGRL